VAVKLKTSQDRDLRAAINPLNHPICLTMPKRLTRYSFWHEHIPFAMFLVDILRPSLIVELGTHYGDSYCAFCQAVRALRLDTRCYAIDTWQGDSHIGTYGPEVLANLRGHHDPLYGGFSNLIQSSFEEALQHFVDGTIDILHIDGTHTYEAIKGDFESWFRKVSSRGVVLLHDTNVRERGFGVSRFWDEIRSRYANFEFLHGSGLGMLVPHQVNCEELRAMLDATDEGKERIRSSFFQLGHRVAMEVSARVTLEQLMNSRSWKLTAPLRKLSSGLRCIRERLAYANSRSRDEAPHRPG